MRANRWNRLGRWALVMGCACAVALIASCGGGGDDGDDDRPTPANDEEAITQVLQDYAAARQDGDVDKLETLFSSDCDREDSEAIIDEWEPLRESFDIQIDGVELTEQSEGLISTDPIGQLLQDGESVGELASDPFLMQRTDDGWKIALCGLVLPNLPDLDILPNR